MTAGLSPLRALAAAELDDWAGLPTGLMLEEARVELPVAVEVTGRARLGERGIPVGWVAVESSVYARGLRLYVEAERVLAIVGRDPVTPVGAPVQAPELGEPELVLDAIAGAARIEDGERVYAKRGLAVQVSPAENALRAVVAFAPTTTEDYVDRLRPEQAIRSPFPPRHGRRS